MRKSIICIALTLTSFSIVSQTQMDSLWTVWNDQTKHDSIRYNALDGYLTQGFLFNQPDSAYVLAQQIIDYGLKNGKVIHQIKGLNSQGISKGIQGDFDTALNHFFNVLKLSESINDKEWIAESLKNIGRVNTIIGDHEKALEYCQSALEIQEEIGDELGKTKSLTNIGLIKNYQNDFKGALRNYKRALAIQEKMNDEKGIANSLIVIAEAHTSLKEYSKVEEYIKRSIAISEKLNNKRALITAKSTLARNFSAKDDFKNAVTAYEELIPLAKEMNDLNLEQNFHHHLYYAHKKIGNASKALESYEKMIALRDSLNSIDMAKKIQKVEFDKEQLADSLEHEADKLKTEMAHQVEVRKKDKNKNIAIAAGLFFLLISGGLFGRWRYTKKAKAIIEKEKDRSENLLLNILPAEVAEELKEKGESEAKDFDEVSVIFTDFQSFTQTAERLTAKELVNEVNTCFKAFDAITENYGVEKIKTIGDAYMAAGGLHTPRKSEPKDVVKAALEMQDFMLKHKREQEKLGSTTFEMRVGVHTGPVVAGIVGVKKFQYDIWGDTVNTASRIESNGEVGKVNISEVTYNYLKDDPDFVFESRGKVQVKGKGEIMMYFVSLT
ncbi:adenylate/guanylate cyclase domain-containing protein [Mangrovimonas cancribranchiae]|uniref:Adenylate/guanylate cyclase domain-containing protein n=1 Tax=Mangrovimonas cancribranchiae TaxID=3080055 RepID=A0AAU6P041_9FLAO